MIATHAIAAAMRRTATCGVRRQMLRGAGYPAHENGAEKPLLPARAMS